MTITHQFITVQNIRTHYMEAGQGDPPVVLLHGGGIDNASLSWGLLLPELARERRVIAFDWPGYGESERPRVQYSIRFYVDFLAAFLDTLGIPRAGLVGISLGGGVALGFTLRWPERVEKLVLVDSYGLQRKTPFHALGYLFIHLPWVNELSWAMMRSRPMARWSLQALLKRPGSVTDELVEQVYREILREDASRAWMAFQKDEATWSGTRTCYLDRLGEIAAPTLIIHGTRDSLVPAEDVREAHRRIPGSKLHWMEGSGHWPQRDDPEEFNRVVVDFLRR